MGLHERLCPTCGHKISSHGVEVDVTTGLVRCGDWSTTLPRRHVRALSALVAAYPNGLSRDQIARSIYDDHWDDHIECPEQNVFSHISLMRRALRKAGAPFGILARRFIGYRLVMEPDGVDRPVA